MCCILEHVLHFFLLYSMGVYAYVVSGVHKTPPCDLHTHIVSRGAAQGEALLANETVFT